MIYYKTIICLYIIEKDLGPKEMEKYANINDIAQSIILDINNERDVKKSIIVRIDDFGALGADDCIKAMQKIKDDCNSCNLYLQITTGGYMSCQISDTINYIVYNIMKEMKGEAIEKVYNKEINRYASFVYKIYTVSKKNIDDPDDNYIIEI